jgi:hypothetical protein
MNAKSPFTKLFTLCILALVFTFSCKKETDIQPDGTDETLITNTSEHFSIVDAPEEEGIPGRVQTINTPIILSDTSLDRSGCNDFATWTHVAEVVAPVSLQGEVLSSTNVFLAGSYAFVAYHLRGGTHRGLVEAMSLQTPAKPKITSQAYFLDADVNAVALESKNHGLMKFWVAASHRKYGAILYEILFNGTKFQQSSARMVVLSRWLKDGAVAASANAVEQAGDYLYVSAGKANGGIFCLRASDLSLVGLKEFSNAKGIAVNSGKVAGLLSGDDSKVLVENVGGSNFNTSYSLGKIYHQNVEDEDIGKTTLNFKSNSSDMLFVAAGAEGLKVLNAADGIELWSSPKSMLPFGNANAVTLDNRYVYVANGADGLAIFPLDEAGLPNESKVFLWDLNEQHASANYVQTKDSWVFIAKGKGGLKILKTPNPDDRLPVCSHNSSGTPTCLLNDPVGCNSILLDLLPEKLPLNANQSVTHPEYFTDGNDEITLQQDAEIFLTFLDENSKFTSSLGYYFYPTDCPPASPSDMVGLVAFPNFSKQGSGGGLLPGNTVKLKGIFREGTKVGFFVLKNGWNSNGTIGNGAGILYANPAFNPGEKKQSLLFHDAGCNTLVGAFEYNPIPSDHADFRDLVFQVSISPADAIESHEYLRW